jgi:branched-chain amino acid aminotransferase
MVASSTMHGVTVHPVAKIWLDGKMVDWEHAHVHVLTHSLHYGLAAFEGIRSYKRADGRSVVFRLVDHIDRLLDSCHIATLAPQWSREELVQACLETLRVNQMTQAYLRPIVFLGDGGMGLGSLDNPTRAAVVVYEWGAYLGDEGLRKGIRAKVSSYTRSGLNSMMSKGKLTGQYVNSVLAKREVMKAGYAEAILLDGQGRVAEASGENIFMVKGGRLMTPPLSEPILAGITRDTVLALAGDLGVPVSEQVFGRDELYLADEVFLTGTAAELSPVREIDDRRIGAGEPGPITRRMQEAFFETVKGATPPKRPGWLTYV